MGFVEFPMVGARAIRVFSGGNERTVREGSETLFHCHQNLLGHFFVWTVDGWKPNRVGLGFALCPYLWHFKRVFAGWINEVQTLVFANGIAASRAF